MESKQWFFITNKDIFLRYFEDGYYSASIYYDNLIKEKNYKKLEEVIKSKTEFKTSEFINKLKE